MRGIVALVLFVIVVSCSKHSPKHVRLSISENTTSYQVTFTTTTMPSKPSVSFWPLSNTSDIIVLGPGDTKIFVDPVGTIYYIVSITITPLTPETQYSYFVSAGSEDNDDDDSSDSNTFQFYSLPYDSSPVKIGIFADMGSDGSALEQKGEGGLVYWAQKHLVDFMIHNGDLAYSLGSESGETGKDFLDDIEPVSATVPYMVSAGNHEYKDDSAPYYKNWFIGQAPLGEGSNSSDPVYYYSFDIGSKLHIVVISTEAYCEDIDTLVPQYTWLENDIKGVRQRSVQPWILVFGHRQMYIGAKSTFHSRLMRYGLQCEDSSLQNCDYKPCESGINCAYSIEQLLNDYNVDMYFAGHKHTYNRMYPITKNMTYEKQDKEKYINPQHPVYIVSGAAGTQTTSAKSVVEEPSTDYTGGATIINDVQYSFSLLTIYNDTHIQLEQISVKNGKVADSFWIEKNPKLPPCSKTTSFKLKDDTESICQ